MEDIIRHGEALFAEGNIEEAEKCFLSLLEENPENEELLNNLGVIHHFKGNFEKAEDYLLKALSAKEDYQNALLNLANLYKDTKRWEKAALQLEKSIAIDDQDPNLYNQLNLIYLEMGDSQKAREVLAKFLKLNPDQEIVRQSLSVLEKKDASSKDSNKEIGKGEAFLNEAHPQQNRKTKIAVLCLPGLQSFLGDIVDFLKTKYDVRTCYSNNKQEIEAAVHRADIVWLEWANELTIALSNHPTILNGKRVICRLHSYEAFSGYAGKINWEKISDLIFVAEHIKNIVLQQIPDLLDKVKNVHIIPNGINLDKFPFKDRSKGKNLAYIGYINYKKGPMLLLHAFRELVQLDEQYKLFIAGVFQDARYELYFSQMIQEMSLEENVELCGWIENIEAWLNDKNYIVSSSVLESQGMGIMEAMASGLKPVIHNFVGAKGIYPTEYLWNVIPDFVRNVTEKNYDSSEYRKFIEANYSLDIQLRKIIDIVSNQKKVKQILVTSNMIADNTEKSGNDVTAIIAVRNGSATIKKTLDSLLSQTVPLKKIIVVDDCSNDETPKLVEDYAAKSNCKIELLKLPYNHWVYKARNAAFEKIKTDFFFFLDADDFVDPLYTERLLTLLRENPNCAFAYSDMTHFNESQQVQTSLPDFDVTTLMERNYIPYSALMRSKDFRSLGGYSNYLNDCRNHMTEWDLWLRFVAAGKVGKRYPKPIFYYYQNADQMSKNYERTRSDMKIQMALNRGASITLNSGNERKTLLVCQGRDYLDRTKVGFEVYTWLKPLAKFGEVFTFFYDVESQYFGQDGMIKRLLSLINQIQPTYIFHPAYKEHISIDCWKEISKRFMTIVWFSDDNWRFDTYSKFYCQGFRFAITTYPEIFERYKDAGYSNILLSQWAANTEYFKDYGLLKNIDVSFAGQNYGDRAVILDGLNVQCFGPGWPVGMLDFPEMAKVLNRSKISINFSKGADGRLQMKCRPFEIAASNTLLLCENTENLGRYYKNDEEVIVFENKKDLKKKLEYYLTHEEERKRIAKAAYERTVKEHTWLNRFEKIFKSIGLSFSDNSRTDNRWKKGGRQKKNGAGPTIAQVLTQGKMEYFDYDFGARIKRRHHKPMEFRNFESENISSPSGKTFSNLIDVKTFFVGVKDYVILKISEDFPNYSDYSDIDILCRNRNQFLSHLLTIGRAYETMGFTIKVSTLNGHIHVDFYPPNATKLNIRFDLLDSLSTYKSVVLDNEFLADIFHTRVKKIVNGTEIFTPSLKYDLAIRFLEYIEWKDTNPSKVKHLEYIQKTNNLEFIEAINQYTSINIQVRNKGGKVEPIISQDTPPVKKSQSHPHPSHSIFYHLSSTCQIPDLDFVYQKYLGRKFSGTFVEVGAFDGEYVSNTSGLADIGWNGYYIEPVPYYFEKCKERHKCNKNVTVSQLAIGAEPGSVNIHVAGPLSTIKNEMKKHFETLDWAKNYFTQNKQVQVKTVTLDNYLVRHHIQPGFEILSIDVEGYEWNVLQNFDLAKWHPQMVIIELHDQNDNYIKFREEALKIVEYFDKYEYKAVYKDSSNTIYVHPSIVISRIDYFLIWGHGLPYKDKILDILRNHPNIEIIAIIKNKIKDMQTFIDAIYSCDTVPLEHLKNKIRYLMTTEPEVLFILTRNLYPQEQYFGEGAFRHIQCKITKDIKEEIRNKFNPRINGKRTEDHVVHASDYSSQVIHVLNVLGLPPIEYYTRETNAKLDAPYHLTPFENYHIQEININDLHASLQGMGLIPIIETPHYKYLHGDKSTYEHYHNSYLGTLLTDDHTTEAFDQMINNFHYDYTTKKGKRSIIIAKMLYPNRYQILDGVHRAVILKFQGKARIKIAVPE